MQPSAIAKSYLRSVKGLESLVEDDQLIGARVGLSVFSMLVDDDPNVLLTDQREWWDDPEVWLTNEREWW